MSFSVHDIRGYVMSVCPVAGDVYFGLLFKGVSAGLPTESTVWLLSWMAFVGAGNGGGFMCP